MSAALENTSINASLERYQALFDARDRRDALSDHRRSALMRFLSLGFPTPRDEAWKYTNLRRLESRAFAPADKAPVAIEPAQYPWLQHSGTRIVFVNGHWTPALSAVVPQPPGVTVLTLGEWLQHDAAAALAYLAKAPERPLSAFDSLNTAFFDDGVVVNLAPGAVLDEPVHIVHLWTSNAQLAMSHPRILVRAGRNSQCTLIEQYLSLGDAETFTNAIATFELDSGAKVHHYRLQEESTRAFHIGHVTAHLREHAQFRIHDLSLGASLSRLDIATLLEGSGSHAALRGLLIPSGSQHIDSHTRIEHIAAHTTSEEDYRGIADGRGRGVFSGKVLVHPNAQKTDARQSTRNLLLSSTSEMDSKPELEIYADDVKCSHGATTGQLDATALFYLRSRGLSEVQARALLIRAFAETILSSIPERSVHQHLESRLEQRFGAPQVQS